jgi:AraC-like DNA-binding protein
MDLSVGYREMSPPRALRNALECLWVRVTSPVAGPAVLVLPDAGVDVMWQGGADPFVAGPDTGPMPVEVPPETVLIGARFRPGAAGPALRWSMSELRNRRVDLSDLRPDLAAKLSGDLSPVDAAGQLLVVVGTAVESGPPDPLVRQATHHLADPLGTVDEVSQEVALSGRHLRRRFHETLGYGPKTLQRILRFRRFLGSIGRGDLDLATAATQAGYADQAHLTRECSRLAGMTPTALIGTMSVSFKTDGNEP